MIKGLFILNFDPFSSYVSRETELAISRFIDMLSSWKINTSLVQKETISDIFDRHVLDSLQVVRYLGSAKKILDIGSGAGFPGIVVSILRLEGVSISLCESNLSKSVFLSEVIRTLSLEANVINSPLEKIKMFPWDTVISRATFDLLSLISKVDSVSRGTVGQLKFILHKGKAYEKEVEQLSKNYSFEIKIHPSITSEDGVILELTNVTKIVK